MFLLTLTGTESGAEEDVCADGQQTEKGKSSFPPPVCSLLMLINSQRQQQQHSDANLEVTASRRVYISCYAIYYIHTYIIQYCIEEQPFKSYML